MQTEVARRPLARYHAGLTPLVADMNRNLWLLIAAQGLLLTNNVTFIAINALVGLALAPQSWRATSPVVGYVVGGAMTTGLLARAHTRLGRRASFQLGLAVAVGS